MLIDLKSIDEEGKDFQFDELSDELSGAFSDLIGETPFKIELEIKPLGNTYQILGSVRSQYPEMCSRCGHDIEVPIHNKINEIVVIEKQRPRNTQVSQSQQNFDSSGPSVTYINEPQFDLKEFLHEMMASGFEFYPKCEDRKACDARREALQLESHAKKTGHPGFESLKNFKPTQH
ncbi:MAG: YceD family protein [Pseudomonadota bacterium]